MSRRSETIKEAFFRTWNDSVTWSLWPFKSFWVSVFGYGIIIGLMASIFAMIMI